MLVEGTNITHIRGDTGTIVVKLFDDAGLPILLVTGDIVYFTVKESTGTTAKMLQKVITSFPEGYAEVVLLAEDTQNLRAKDYYYDVQVNRVIDHSVVTVVPPSTFRLAPEVTYE